MTTNRKFSLALEELDNLKLGGNSSDSDPGKPVPAAPSLDRVLSEIGPLPREALFLGIASDGLPVLLNMHDSTPGPMLAIGDAGAGKTIFLQTIALALTLTHQEEDAQYGVLTTHTKEWDGFAATGHRLGVFEINQTAARDFITSVASWAHSNKNASQTILILIDGMEAMINIDPEAVQNLRWLFLRGPARHVWPLITLDAERYGEVLAWLDLFRTRFFGRVANPSTGQVLGGDPKAALENLEPRMQFTLRENTGWLRFWLPRF